MLAGTAQRKETDDDWLDNQESNQRLRRQREAAARARKTRLRRDKLQRNRKSSAGAFSGHLQLRWAQLEPLHELWLQYARALLGPAQPKEDGKANEHVLERASRMDLHGAMISGGFGWLLAGWIDWTNRISPLPRPLRTPRSGRVVQCLRVDFPCSHLCNHVIYRVLLTSLPCTVTASREPALVGLQGIVALETKSVFRIVLKDDSTRTIHKAACTFRLEINGIPLELYGPNMAVNPVARASRKVAGYPIMRL